MTQIHCNYPNDKLSSGELDVIEARMYPNEYSRAGFLQRGERLRDILEADRKYLEQAGITAKQIADRLDTIFGKYTRTRSLDYDNTSTYKDEHILEDRYTVSHISWRGAQECPFQNKKVDSRYHGYEYGDCDITIIDNKTGKGFTFNTLLIHMAKAHQFFESPNCHHRLNPADVIEIFDLQPEVDYQPIYKSYTKWTQYSGSSKRPSKEILNIIEKYALKVYELDNGMGYLWPTEAYIDANDCEKVYVEAINQNLQWSEFRRLVYRQVNKRYSHTKEYIRTDTQIQNEIDKEVALIKDYQKTGNVENLYLILVLDDKPGKIIIEGARVDARWKFYINTFKICKYVPISDDD